MDSSAAKYSNQLAVDLYEGELSELRRIFSRNFIDLLLGQLLWRDTGRTTGFAKKGIQAGWRHHPEQKQFLIGISEPMPGVFGNENCSSFLELKRHIVQYE